MSAPVPGQAALRLAVITEIREAASCESDDGDQCPECARHADAVLAAVAAQEPQAAPELAALRELLDEIGVMAANAPEDGDSFGLLEQIAMQVAAAGVPDSAPVGEWPDPENPVTGRTPGAAAGQGLLAEILGSFASFGRHGQFRRCVLGDEEYQSWCQRAEPPS